MPQPQRIASREIPPSSFFAPPAHSYRVMVQPAYGFGYAAPPQTTLVLVRYEQQQQVGVRETIREENAPGAARVIPAPSPKLIKVR